MVAGFVVSFIGSLLLAIVPTTSNHCYLVVPGRQRHGDAAGGDQSVIAYAGGEEHYAFNSVLAQLIFGGASFLSPLVYSYFVVNFNDSGQ